MSGTADDATGPYIFESRSAVRFFLMNVDETEFELTVDRAGVYAGRCAEFCGLHHADMNFTVVAESRDRFERWLRAQ